MNQSRCILATVALAALLVPQVASAETVYSCVHKSNGNVRIVGAPGQCHKNSENELSWESGSDTGDAFTTLLARVDAIEGALGLFNELPAVSIGANQTILIPDSAHFDGVASDDGLLRPLTFLWEVKSKPEGGQALFSAQDPPVTDVSFTEPGRYVLALNVDDGYGVVFDQADVIVFPDNDPPTVDAGPDQLVTAADLEDPGRGDSYVRGCSFLLEAHIEHDFLPLDDPLVSWSVKLGSNRNYPQGGFTYLFAPVFSNSTDRNTYFDVDFRIPQAYEPDQFHGFSVDLIVSVNDGYFTEMDTVTLYCRSPLHPGWQPSGWLLTE